MKRTIFSVLIVGILCCGILSACGKKEIDMSNVVLYDSDEKETATLSDEEQDIADINTIRVDLLSIFTETADNAQIAYANLSDPSDTATVYVFALSGKGLDTAKGFGIYDSYGTEIPSQSFDPSTVWSIQDINGNDIKLVMLRSSGENDKLIRLYMTGWNGGTDLAVSDSIGEFDNYLNVSNADDETAFNSTVVDINGRHYIAARSWKSDTAYDDNTVSVTYSIELIPLDVSFENELSEDDFYVFVKDKSLGTDDAINYGLYYNLTVNDEAYSKDETALDAQILVQLTGTCTIKDDAEDDEETDIDAITDSLAEWVQNHYISFKDGNGKTAKLYF